MSGNCFKYLLLIIFLCIHNVGISQHFEVSTKPHSLKIDEKRVSGFQKTFDFPHKMMKKEFWRFVTDFGVLKNWRTHYEIIKKPRENANAPLSIYAIVVPTKNGTLIATAKNESAMKGVDSEELDALAKNTLEEFQLHFYQKWLQEKIEDLEKESRKLSRREARWSRKVERWKSRSTPPQEKIQSKQADIHKAEKELQAMFEKLDAYRANLASLLK